MSSAGGAGASARSTSPPPPPGRPPRSSLPGGGAVDLAVAVLEAVHARELQQTDLPEERLEHPLRDERDAGRPLARAVAAREPPEGLRGLEAPRVRLDPLEDHRVVGRQTDRDQHGAARRVEA